MKKIKEEKGITLVALIITIVVLLILAAVAIGSVKNSDIIGYAQNASGSYNQSKANEANALSGYENILNKYAIGDVPNEKKLYDQAVSNPNDFIGAKVRGYTANGYSDWVILETRSEGYVRLILSDSNTIPKYNYDTSKTNSENLQNLLTICEQYRNADLATSATLLTTDEYKAFYDGEYGDYTGSLYWTCFRNINDGTLCKGTSGGYTSAIDNSSEYKYFIVVDLKGDVLLKDGGSKESGYELYINN